MWVHITIGMRPNLISRTLIWIWQVMVDHGVLRCIQGRQTVNWTQYFTQWGQQFGRYLALDGNCDRQIRKRWLYKYISNDINIVTYMLSSWYRFRKMMYYSCQITHKIAYLRSCQIRAVCMWLIMQCEGWTVICIHCKINRGYVPLLNLFRLVNVSILIR